MPRVETSLCRTAPTGKATKRRHGPSLNSVDALTHVVGCVLSTSEPRVIASCESNKPEACRRPTLELYDRLKLKGHTPQTSRRQPLRVGPASMLAFTHFRTSHCDFRETRFRVHVEAGRLSEVRSHPASRIGLRSGKTWWRPGRAKTDCR